MLELCVNICFCHLVILDFCFFLKFMNQTRQGMALKMENPGGNPGMRPGMQPGMGGQVDVKNLFGYI